jgi:hypothetical protein
MFNDSPYAQPVGSFQNPVPVPTSDPDVGACFSISLSQEWRPYIIGALQQLLLQSTWDTSDPDVLNLVQARAMTLIAMFGDAKEANCDEGTAGCGDIWPDSSIIEYNPQDPFRQPGYVPPGYIQPPFYVVTSAMLPILFLGAQVGDVLTGYLSIPVTTPSIGQGLARFRVNVTGKGRMNIHLINVPSGGSALITQDDNPFTARFVELNKDLVSIPPETIGIIIVEAVFDTPGPHHVDVTFIPRFNDELIFAAYGGGVRKIELCGFDEFELPPGTPGATPGPFFEVDDDMTQMRQNGCKLEVLCTDGTWSTIYDPTNCIATGTIQPPAGGTLMPDECIGYDVVLRGNDRWILPVSVKEGSIITITSAQGGWYSAVGGWFCPNGQAYALGLCFGPGATFGTDPAPTVNRMRLIAHYNTEYLDAYNATITIPVGVTDTNLEFQANDDDLTDNGGSISFHVDVCNSAVATWEHLFDFTTGEHGFAQMSVGYNAAYSAGVGYVTGAAPAGVVIQMATIPPMVIIGAEATVHGATAVAPFNVIDLLATLTGYNIQQVMVNGDQTYSTSGPDVVNPSVIEFDALPGAAGSSCTLVSVKLRGRGVMPTFL